jgi:hypothetical protein
MNPRSQIICAWCGILCPVLLFVAIWPVAGFFPPHLPSASAAEIAAIYQQNTNNIRFGTILMLISGGLYGPYTAAIAAQMRRMENRETPVLSYTQLAVGSASILLFIIPALIWSVAAFRPDRPAEITQALNDLGWFFFVMPFVLGFIQNLALGFAIFTDKNPTSIFPRWVGFFNVWIAVLFIPGCLLTFFKTGPFAWNGILAFWIPACIFGPWFWVVSITVIKAAKQQALELRS